MSNPKQLSWSETFKAFTKPTVITMLFLGFSAGIPILLIFSSLGLWLREAGVERSSVTFFSWAALGYSFKFIWAPLVDRLPLPFLTRIFGRRRGWMLLSQLIVILAIAGMAFTNPANSTASLTAMALAAVLLGFSSATQDIVIDAYRIESDTADMQALLSSAYIVGYRVAMILAGAGTIFLAEEFGSTMETYSYSAWKWAYLVMAGFMLIGVLTTLIAPEPKSNKKSESTYKTGDYFRFFVWFLFAAGGFITVFVLTSDVSNTSIGTTLAVLGKGPAKFLVESLRLLLGLLAAGFIAIAFFKTQLVNRTMVQETYIDPVKDFFKRYGTSFAILLLALVGLYRISDIVLGVISNVFYQDLGYSKQQIAAVVKTFGVIMTIVGGVVGGVATVRFGVMKMLFIGALLASLTNLLFMALASMGSNMTMLYVVISLDNLAAGLASAAFIAFLSSLTNFSFTAIQYAIFSSLMTLFPKLIGGYSGTMVDEMGYSNFFLLTALMGVPVLCLVWLAGRSFSLKPNIGSN